MNGVLVDANVILDIVTDDPRWSGWSAEALASSSQQYVLFVNTVIYAEVSIGFERIEQLESVLPAERFRRLSIPWEAAFLAGKVFLQYRRSGGTRPLPLPDFFIGAHALVANLIVLTRDPRRFRRYFPGLQLIAP